MELPYKFVAYRGQVNGVFENYVYTILGCMDGIEEVRCKSKRVRSWYSFMIKYKEDSLKFGKPTCADLPWPLKVRVGEPVLTRDEIEKGQRRKNYVYYDTHTDNLCTVDYSLDDNECFVCVLDRARVPAWLKSGCYGARICFDGPSEMWSSKGERDFEGNDGAIQFFVSSYGPHASVVVVLDKWVKPLDGRARDLHEPERIARERAARGNVLMPFPRSLGEFVESFRVTFNI